MAGESYEPTDPGRWVDHERRSSGEQVLRRAFVDDHYDYGGEWDTRVGARRFGVGAQDLVAAPLV